MIKNSFLSIKNTLRNLLKEGLFTPVNLLRVAGIFTKRAFVGPLKLTLDITNDCDMGCAMCLYHSPCLSLKDKPLQLLSLERFKILLKEFREIHTKTILLCGEGEPLLHPQIEEMVEQCRKHSLGVEIITSAYYLDRQKIIFFNKVGVKKIIISLHAADFPTFQRIRPLKTKQTFEKTMENILFLKYIRRTTGTPQIFIINVISSLNYHNSFEMVKLAEDLNADKIIFKPLTLTPNLPQNLRLSKDENKILINNLEVLSKQTAISNNLKGYIHFLRNINHEQQNFMKVQKEAFKQNSLLPCHIPWTNSTINMKGDVIGCVYSQTNPLGNIYENSFADIWFGEKYTSFRKAYFCPKECKGKAVFPLLFK